MTDLEIIEKCARKFFYGRVSDLRNFNVIDGKLYVEPDDETGHIVYDPLHDDAQAFALLKWYVSAYDNLAIVRSETELDLNRAICECVAKMPETH